MSDTKEKIGVSVRVPQWVLDEIEEDIRACPRPRPTRGDLIETAWRRFKDGAQTNGTRGDNSREGGYHESPGTAVGEMLTALISSGRKSEVDAILRLIRAMFEQGAGRGADPLPKTGHADFDQAAEAVMYDGEELSDRDADLPTERRRTPKRTA